MKDFYISTRVTGADFSQVLDKVIEALKSEGFGVLTEIDVRKTLKEKIDVEFRNYKILGACNPHFAYKALQSEEMIGTMLPCNIVVQERQEGTVEVAAVDPIASMSAVENPDLKDIALEVKDKLERVIRSV
jgi:uncharacterized protein (DUF302 family)